MNVQYYNGIYLIRVLMHLPGAGIPMRCIMRSALSVISGVCADGATTIFCLKTVKIYRFMEWYNKRIKKEGGGCPTPKHIKTNLNRVLSQTKPWIYSAFLFLNLGPLRVYLIWIYFGFSRELSLGSIVHTEVGSRPTLIFLKLPSYCL